MGNVMARSSTNPSPGVDASKLRVPEPEKPSPLLTPLAAPLADIKSTTCETKKRENPGTIADLHKKCKDIQAITFEGAIIMLNKRLNNQFQVSHCIDLSILPPSGYHFGAMYLGTKQFSPTEVFPVLLGEINPSGNFKANIIHQFFNPRVRCKLVSQIQESRLTVAQMTADYHGDDYTASLTVGNPNILNNSGVLVGQYLQSVTSKLAMGTELAYQYGSNVPGGKIAVASLFGRYTNGDSIWSGTIGMSVTHLCYYQKASEQLQIGVEMETHLGTKECVATIGYQVEIPKGDFTFRGSFDSNWNVCGQLEKRLQPLPFSFGLSGCLNHSKNQFTLGCGLIIG